MSATTFSELNQISFPNPVSDKINISTNITLDRIEIYNLLGNLVLKTDTNTNEIDVTSLTSGIYLISIYSGKEKIVKKIIVE
jgi:hypothetical protein